MFIFTMDKLHVYNSGIFIDTIIFIIIKVEIFIPKDRHYSIL
jgi:hypothetical protein